MIARKKKIAVAALALPAQITGITLSVDARDNGQSNDVPQHVRDWFKRLKNRRNGGSCCDQSDCARTEARTRENKWEARLPNGAWISIPDDQIVYDRGNPTGEPILCAIGDDEGGWRVVCFVPGPGG